MGDKLTINTIFDLKATLEVIRMTQKNKSARQKKERKKKTWPVLLWCKGKRRKMRDISWSRLLGSNQSRPW